MIDLDAERPLSRLRLHYGEIKLIPVTDASGFVVEDVWHIPGGGKKTTSQLRRMGQRRGIRVSVVPGS